MALFRPFMMKNRITDLAPSELKSLGIKGLLLDVDNTLALHFDKQPLDGVEQWISAMKDAGILLTIVSNAPEYRVKPFADRLGLSFRYTCLKPLPFKLKRALKEIGLRRQEVFLCGDQLFTDMLCAHLSGVKGLLVTPVECEDKWHFRLRRFLEKPLLKGYKKGGKVK